MRIFLTSFVAATAACCFIGTSFAQELEVDSEVQQTESTQTEMTVIAGDGIGPSPMIFSTSESIGPGGISSGVRIMSCAPGGFGFMGDGGGMEMNRPAPDAWSMLSNPSVQKDLELVGDQLK